MNPLSFDDCTVYRQDRGNEPDRTIRGSGFDSSQIQLATYTFTLIESAKSKMGEKEESRCPVDHNKLGKSSNGPQQSSLWQLFVSSNSEGNPNITADEQTKNFSVESDRPTKEDGSGCPVDHGRFAGANNKITNERLAEQRKSVFSSWFGETRSQQEEADETEVVASLEEAAKYAQTPHPGQTMPLSTYRSTSSIPRGVKMPEAFALSTLKRSNSSKACRSSVFNMASGIDCLSRNSSSYHAVFCLTSCRFSRNSTSAGDSVER